MNKQEQTKIKRIALWFLDLGINILVIFGLVVVIQTWIMAPFDVSGGSMCNTLNFIDGKCINNYGEKIIINEALYIFSEPARGDIVVFNIPEIDNDNEKYFIKRVIGLPNETVKIEDGHVSIKTAEAGEFIKLEESYLNESNNGKTKTYFDGLNTFEVPEDHYLVLGDNRNSSTDSRSCFLNTISTDCKENIEKAFVSTKNIRGKASLVWWPLSQMRLIKETKYEELSK